MIRTPVLIVTIQQIVQDTGEIVRCWPACFIERRNLFPLQANSKARQTVAQKSRWLHPDRVSIEATRWTSATDSVFSSPPPTSVSILAENEISVNDERLFILSSQRIV